ncbi:MAG: toxin, partial [Anaerococcus sp.]|nr:toxin [Anaerococcus sp.]
IKEGYTYQQLASLYDVNVNLMIFKLNEMHRMGLPVNKNIADSKFFTKIDGRDEFYGNLE